MRCENVAVEALGRLYHSAAVVPHHPSDSSLTPGKQAYSSLALNPQPSTRTPDHRSCYYYRHAS